jgi:hypothetical protein
MAVRRLGVVNPGANTDSLGFTSVGAAYLASVIVTNKGGTDQTARVWVKPSGATLTSQYGYIVYDVVVPAANSIETHRFAISDGDQIWVRGNSANLSFMINGVYDSTASFDDHLIDTTSVHGIADTSQLATLAVTNALNTRLVSIELGLGIFD